MRRVCVFCGSSSGTDPRYREAASAMGRTLAERGIELVYGGGAVGLMGVIADAVMEAGGTVIGVLPKGLFSREVGHEAITELRHTDSMHERKALMYELADAFIALPGGLGTLDELFETLTWAQIGLHAKPVGLLDVDGYFDQLLAFLQHTVDTGFVKQANIDLLVADADPAGLLARLAANEPPRPEKWIDPVKI
ncbi:MAG: TIGR00730 family Rossman fold protein [Acidimicrobiales bacterium]|nr:TIGR00730 family Rossman fold protein [Acidimicrobiales bacterium]